MHSRRKMTGNQKFVKTGLTNIDFPQISHYYKNRNGIRPERYDKDPVQSTLPPGLKVRNFSI